MPAKYFIVDKKADKQFLKLPKFAQKRVILAYRALRENPISGSKLKGELSEYYKYRIGDWRIVYKFDSKRSIIEVVKIEHRQGVYR